MAVSNEPVTINRLGRVTVDKQNRNLMDNAVAANNQIELQKGKRDLFCAEKHPS